MCLLLTIQQTPTTCWLSRTKPNYYFDNKIMPADKRLGRSADAFCSFSSFTVSSVVEFCTFETIVRYPVFDFSQWETDRHFSILSTKVSQVFFFCLQSFDLFHDWNLKWLAKFILHQTGEHGTSRQHCIQLTFALSIWRLTFWQDITMTIVCLFFILHWI